MRLVVYTWPYALFFWAVFIWAFAPEFRLVSRPHEPSDTSQDANSKRLIMQGGALAGVIAFAVAIRVPGGALPNGMRLFWIGLCVFIAGSLLRRHCRRMLGRNFTGAVIVKPDQAVVERGAYGYVRHPSYTAGALLWVGIGLALANWISLLVLISSIAIMYAYRVRVEEAALVSVIGQPYRDYMKRTKRFIPFVF
ncbi:MAG TPA: isoprenylcysteine carboxylmethyltransferase family protein [Candidatus Baltobacteraceae bacterium]|nr:isoprenylcysteine carboxylmethyltransferase family protein [Candidatus Baltobacteraceae bacterium]